ncbi:MAG: cytochrome c [Deltaproteobacteria bacterium]|nr:cytochrome c [Deltaproteobacteria bacterium]
MVIEAKKCNRFFSFTLSIVFTCILTFSWAWGQTYVSGKVITSDGMVVTSGAVALEKGKLHNNAFRAGGGINADGTFKIPLPSGGPWGLHVYSEKYIYFPLQLQVTKGIDNEIPVILPVDGNSGDDPQISNIRFLKITDQVFRITMQVDDPNSNLGPQMLAIDTKRFKSYRLVPKAGDLKDIKADFPSGEYVSPFIPVALDGENPKDWLFAVADHQCSNGSVYNGLGRSVFNPPLPHTVKLICEVPGIWKSNFGKVYKFSQTAPNRLSGEQFEGNLTIDQISQEAEKIFLNIRFKGEKGKAGLQLLCKENSVIMKGSFSLPERSGEWIFTKLKNAKVDKMGQDLFMANCSACHYPDQKDTKVGPGLLGLLKNPKLPSGLPANGKNVRKQIINGGKNMPPFKHLKDDQISVIIDYLKTL